MKRLILTFVFLLASTALALSQTVIYSNLGSQKGKIYDCCNGYQFEFNTSISAVAVPFIVPEGVTELDHVVAAVQWVSGYAPHYTNWTLAADKDGLPGGGLAFGSFYRLPKVNSCCKRMTGGKSKRLQLSSGAQYWLVLSWVSTGIIDQWAYNTTGATDPFAIEDQNGWYLVTGMTTPAVKIVGK